MGYRVAGTSLLLREAARRGMPASGTNRTNRAGLAMSVDLGRPEVVGRPSYRRY